MKGFALVIFVLIIGLTTSSSQTLIGPNGEEFTARIVKDRLSDTWEVTYGPDNYLWITEAKGYSISRINPATGEKITLLDLSGKREFPRYDKIPDEQDGGKPWPQGGLMGLALHPQLLAGKPYVYASYLYRFAAAADTGNGNRPNFGGNYFTTKIVRYEYDSSTQKLINEQVISDTILGSNDHNSGRLLIAPVDGKDFLFYTVGDLGAGQFDNGGRPNHAQNINYYEGKVLRFSLELTTKNQNMSWIPADNPFNNNRQSAVWSYGHRNAQGMIYGVMNGVGRIYSSEHGPYGDDEINIIEKGKNYGHPLVIGYNDNNYNGFAASVSDRVTLPGKWHTTYPLITSENANATAIGKDFRGPIKSFHPATPDSLSSIFSRTVSGNKEGVEWKAEGPSSIAFYSANTIPGWKNSLLIPTLKGNKLIRLKLNANGDGIVGDTINYFKGKVRYRDIAISPDGRKIYLAVDSSATTSGPSEQHQEGTNYNGCIIEFTYIKGGIAKSEFEPKKAIISPKIKTAAKIEGR
jgi:PQQ-dependent dehydrogenase (s-GDH family)